MALELSVTSTLAGTPPDDQADKSSPNMAPVNARRTARGVASSADTTGMSVPRTVTTSTECSALVLPATSVQVPAGTVSVMPEVSEGGSTTNAMVPKLLPSEAGICAS